MVINMEKLIKRYCVIDYDGKLIESEEDLENKAQSDVHVLDRLKLCKIARLVSDDIHFNYYMAIAIIDAANHYDD